MEHLKENDACPDCLQPKHKITEISRWKYSCYHCKGLHNSALCYTKYKKGVQDAGQIEKKLDVTTISKERIKKVRKSYFYTKKSKWSIQKYQKSENT